MQHCVYCGAETILIVNRVPVCVECDNKLKSKTLPLKCVKCGAATTRLVAGVPYCRACDEKVTGEKPQVNR